MPAMHARVHHGHLDAATLGPQVGFPDPHRVEAVLHLRVRIVVRGRPFPPDFEGVHRLDRIDPRITRQPLDRLADRTAGVHLEDHAVDAQASNRPILHLSLAKQYGLATSRRVRSDTMYAGGPTYGPEFDPATCRGRASTGLNVTSS